MLARMWRKRNTPPLLVGLQACITTLEVSLVVPQKIGHSTARGTRNTSLGYISVLSGEKVKAYLRRGAKPIRGEVEYPNARVGDYDIIVSSQQGASKIKVFRWFSPNIFSLQKQ